MEHNESFAGVPKLLITARQVADLISVSPKRVYELSGLVPIRISERSLRWSLADVMAWIASRREAR